MARTDAQTQEPNRTQARFLEGGLFRHVTVMSLTASLGMMAIFAVDFIDMVFIAMLGRAELAAAVGYAASILFFTTSFGIGMAIAAAALVSRALGSGDGDLARTKASNALILGVIAAALFAAAVWVSLGPLVRLLGATGETENLAIHYLQIIVPTLPFLVAGMMGSAILRAHGAAKAAMWATLWGGIVNAVLDPILIFGAGLDLTGAAIASAAARVAIAFAALWPIFRHHGGLVRPTLPQITADLRPVFAIALPAILTQLATPVGQAYVTRAMAEFGEAAVAGMAIVGRLTPLSFAVIFALSGAVGPIIGQNAGAERADRVRGAFRAAMLFAGMYVVAVSVLLFVLRGPIAALFGAEGLTREIVFLFCGPLALFFYFNGVLFVANAAFNNLGRPFWSTALNWGRHTLGTVPPVMLGAWWLGAPGVLIGQALGGVLFGVLAVVLARLLMAEPRIAPARDPAFTRLVRQTQLFFSRR